MTRSSSGLIILSLVGRGRALKRRKRMGMARRYMNFEGIVPNELLRGRVQKVFVYLRFRAK